MSDQEKLKLNRFMRDDFMVESVRKVILQSFIRSGKGQRDVHVLAAERIAVELLEDAWKELAKYKEDIEKDVVDKINNVGL